MSKLIAKAPVYLLFCLFALSQSTESVFTTGLPQISAEFSIDPGLAQACSSIYFFGFAVGIFIFGRVSDYLGRKPVVIFGLSLFLLTCLLSFFINDIYFLIAIRFFQAFGASVGSVIAQAMARDSYKGIELSRLYANLAAGLSIMPAVGSLIGGNIVELFGWRYNFIYLFSIIFCVYLGCIFKLPETNEYIGKTQEKSFFAILKIMLKDKKVLSYAAIIGGFNGIMYSFYIEAPFIFIKKLHIHPSKYGFLILLLSFAGACGSLFSRFLQNKGVEGKRIIETGLQVSIVSCIIFVIFGSMWSFEIMPDKLAMKILIIPIVMQGMCFSVVMPLILRYSLENYASVNGTAGSIFGTFYYLLVSIINFTTTLIHSETITKFTFFCLGISITSYLIYISSRDSNV